MIKVTYMPTVDTSDIEDSLGIRVLDCEFTQMVENDSYISLDISRERIKELTEDIEYYRNRDKEHGLIQRLENELNLIKELRLQGISADSVLVFVSW